MDLEDVQLTAEGPAPDPHVVRLILAVNNEGNPPEEAVIDRVWVDVYDDACEAAAALGLDPYKPGDFGKNCVTDANDLAELGAKWPNYTGLTGPIVK